MEYKALPEGDSGIYLRGIPQVQIWDATIGDPRGLGQDKGSGGLWNNSKGAPGKDPSKKMDKPFGEWNQLQDSHDRRARHDRVQRRDGGGQRSAGEFLREQEGRVPGLRQAGRSSCCQEGRREGRARCSREEEKPLSQQTALPNGWIKDPAFPKGPIQLQTHGSEIRWRNVFIREIPAEEANKELASRDAEGFEEQINDKDLGNWQGAVENYEVKDGAIVCKQGKGGDLLTKEEFENGIIRVEFKLPPAGNNGIALRTPLGGHSASDGLELQVIDSDGYNAKQAAAGKPGLKPEQYHGSLYYCVGAKHGYLRPVGEWNFQEIEVQGQKIKVTLNGTKILDVDIDTFDRSQFPKVPKGLDARKGLIGFAGHSDPVEYRSFKVKRM